MLQKVRVNSHRGRRDVAVRDTATGEMRTQEADVRVAYKRARDKVQNREKGKTI